MYRCNCCEEGFSMTFPEFHTENTNISYDDLGLKATATLDDNTYVNAKSVILAMYKAMQSSHENRRKKIEANGDQLAATMEMTAELGEIYGLINFSDKILHEAKIEQAKLRLGKWKLSSFVWECSECKRKSMKKTNFCPHCGSKMKATE